MKNKLFVILIVILILVTLISWIRGQSNTRQVKEINREINEIKYNLYLINLKASTLIEEMEMMSFKSELELKNKRTFSGKNYRRSLLKK